LQLLALGYAVFHFEGTWRYSQILLGQKKKETVHVPKMRRGE